MKTQQSGTRYMVVNTGYIVYPSRVSSYTKGSTKLGASSLSGFKKSPQQGFMPFKSHVLVPVPDIQVCADAHLRGNSNMTCSDSIQLTAKNIVQFRMRFWIDAGA